MKLQYFLTLLSILFYSGVFSQNQLENTIQEFRNLPDYKNASIGVYVEDLQSGNSVFNLNAEQLFIPASTVKLITTASALQILGEEYRFKTRIGYRGELEKNQLKGDLVLLGGGDPALGSRYFANHYFGFLEHWAKAIKSEGITKISGNLVLDAGIYDSEKVPASWIWEDIGNYYGAGANAFTVYDNLYEITFSSPKEADRPTQVISIQPEIPGLEINNLVISSDVNSDNAYVFGSPFDKKIEIRGTIPKNRKTFTIKAAMHFSQEILAREFIEVLAREGIFIEGKVIFEKINRNSFKEVFVQESPSLSEIIKEINFKSINLFSEHLVKQIAFEKTGVGNRQAGIEVVKNYWNSRNLNVDAIFLEDGSGLSHFNAVSPMFFVKLLKEMKHSYVFRESLPAAGEGTIYQFCQGNFPGKSLQAKSGSMTRVRCYAGYLSSEDKNYAFSIMVNHFSGTHGQLSREIEKILVAIKK